MKSSSLQNLKPIPFCVFTFYGTQTKTNRNNTKHQPQQHHKHQKYDTANHFKFYSQITLTSIS